MLTGSYCTSLAAEITRYSSARTQWTADAFIASTPELLGEMVAVGDHRAGGVLSDSSVEQLRGQAHRQVLDDPGVGSRAERGAIAAVLPKPGRAARGSGSARFGAGSYSSVALSSELDRVRSDYVANWATEFGRAGYARYEPGAADRDVTPPQVAAAYIAAFFSGLGMSREYLARWTSYRVGRSPQTLTLTDLMSDLQALRTGGYGPAELLVVLADPIAPDIEATGGWLGVAEVRDWLAANGSTPPRTLHGGVVYRMHQWDIYAAMDQVARAVDKLRHRVRLATGKNLNIHPQVWIKGIAGHRALPRRELNRALLPGYGLSAPSAEHPGSENRLEVAIDFLQGAYLTGGPSAVGTLWATLESLFASPGDEQRGVEVVRRATSVALVAFVRHQVQACLGRVRSQSAGGAMAAELALLDDADRITHLERHLRAEPSPGSTDGVGLELAHTGALLRPEHLALLRTRVEDILFGLYRHRNLILHGGVVDAPMLGSVLRDGATIVGAVVNRYARVASGTATDPLLLAYRSGRLVDTAVNRSTPLAAYFAE